MRQIENPHAEQYFSRTAFAKKIRTYKKGKYLLREGDGLLFSLLPRGPPLPAGPAFGGEGRIRSLLTQARATRMNLTSLLLVNLELA